MEGMLMAGMYGYSDEDWEYIWKNADFWEVFIPIKGGYKRARKRKKFWESVGFEVFPYEDKGVSVGIYVMTKDGVRTYGERSGLIKLILFSLVKQKCCNFVSDECHGSLVGKCIGGDVNGGKLKRESQTAVIYQYPYEFTYPNAGLCWVQEGITCDYFEQAVLPSGNEAIAEEYEECVSDSNIEEQEPRFCKCGNILSDHERKCIICKRKARRLRNRKFRGSN
jgi:hypothetical protein